MSIKLFYIGRNDAFIETIFLNKNIELVSKDSGFNAYKYMAEHPSSIFDVIFMEENTTGIKDVELMRYLKSSVAPNALFFIVGSHFSHDDAERFLKAGIADGFLFDASIDGIAERITYLLGHRNETPVEVVQQEYRIPIVKRIFDILVAGSTLLLISPLLLIVILLIRLESKGKVYYTSKRVGTGYKIFDFYKLRSMYTGADAKLKELSHLNQYAAEGEVEVESECPDCKRLGHPCSPILMVDGGEICENFYLKKKRMKHASAFIKIKDDPRITKVGKFIRNTSIDELPQLINVIKGDMSIVGNRPLPLYEAELLTSDQWILRFMAPAGITGLWQTKKRGKGAMSEEERKSLDNEYALNYSILNDIRIILMTIPALLQKENV